MSETRSRTYGSLDFWRGFAAIWVVLFHSISGIQTDFGQKISGNVFTAFCSWGDAGVILFFVISGYCIAVAGANLIDRNQTVSSFISARARRIYPPHWIVLVLFLCMCGLAFLAQERGIISASNLALRFTLLTPWSIITNATLLQVLFREDSINIVAWTLCYEVAFYAVMTVAIVLFRRQGWQIMVRALHVVTIVAFVISVFFPRWAVFPFNLWVSFGIGILLFDLLCGKPIRKYSSRERVFYGGILLSLLVVMVTYVAYNLADRGAWQTALTLPFALLLYFLRPLDQKIVQSKIMHGLLWVGSFSYSLYLTHFLILGILRQLAKKIHLPLFLFFLEMFVELAICIAAAYIFYRLVESRFIRSKTPRFVPSTVEASALSHAPLG